MSRTNRITIFVNAEELATIQAVMDADLTLGTNCRRLLMDRANWLASQGRKSYPRRAMIAADRPEPGGVTYDYTDSQDG